MIFDSKIVGKNIGTNTAKQAAAFIDKFFRSFIKSARTQIKELVDEGKETNRGQQIDANIAILTRDIETLNVTELVMRGYNEPHIYQEREEWKSEVASIGSDIIRSFSSQIDWASIYANTTYIVLPFHSDGGLVYDRKEKKVKGMQHYVETIPENKKDTLPYSQLEIDEAIARVLSQKDKLI